MVRGSHRRPWWTRLAGPALAALLIVGASGLGAGRTAAQDHRTIVTILRESRDFRARARAAIALGATADPSVVTPLSGALSDREPAVRAAAASGLGRLGRPDAERSLREALRDSSSEVRDAAARALREIAAHVPSAAPPEAVATPPATPVRPAGTPPATPAGTPPVTPTATPAVPPVPPRPIDWRRARQAVVVGTIANRSGFGADRLAQLVGQEVRRHLGALSSVALLEDGPLDPGTEAQLSRRRLPRLRLEASLARVSRDVRGADVQVRCEVTVMVLAEPGRTIRASLTGAATAAAPVAAQRDVQEQRLAERALEGAMQSAMSGAARAIAGAAAR